MTRRLFLVDADSLYTAAQARYRGKVDFAYLFKQFEEESSEGMEFDAVVFHAEPAKTSSAGFQNLLKSLGYQVNVIPQRISRTRNVNLRCVPLHLAGYLLPRLGRYTHFDFISGDVDYSPVTSYLMASGLRVRLWLFADSLPVFRQDEEVCHSIVTLNERYILDKGYLDAVEDYSNRAVKVLESPHKGSGVVPIGEEETGPEAEEGLTKEEREKAQAFKQATSKGEKIGLALELGRASKTGCEEI